jgi:hypothetical protein
MWRALRAACGVQIGNAADLVGGLRAGGARLRGNCVRGQAVARADDSQRAPSRNIALRMVGSLRMHPMIATSIWLTLRAGCGVQISSPAD